jgi:hypothetical protein
MKDLDHEKKATSMKSSPSAKHECGTKLIHVAVCVGSAPAMPHTSMPPAMMSAPVHHHTSGVRLHRAIAVAVTVLAEHKGTEAKDSHSR